MSTYDVRNNEEVITEIVFSSSECEDGFEQACLIVNSHISTKKYILVSDKNEAVIINSKEHALNLIKALNKAIELGWIE